MSARVATLVSVLLAAVVIGEAAAAPPASKVTAEGLELAGVGRDNPVIYDNDFWTDVPDAAYVWAKASAGVCDLRGNVVTRCTFGQPERYAHQLDEQVREARKLFGLAKASGLRNVPDPVIGAAAALERPAGGRIDDTRFVSTPGSDLIVAEARKATPEKPLLVFCGGSCTTVATACLADSAVAERLIVFQVDGGGYNGSDGWAWRIVMERCRFANWARGYFWNDVSEWRPDRFESLPKNPLCDWLRDYAFEGHGKANQWGDGAWPFWLYDRRCLTRLEDYDGLAVTVPKAGTNVRAMEDEFFATMTDPAVYAAVRAPAGPLKVSDNGRFLADADGAPFFYLADTAWTLFNRMSRDDAVRYLDDRRRKGFTVVQAVGIAEHGGVDLPNAHGRRPFRDVAALEPDVTPGSDPRDAEQYDYWDHVDFVADEIARRGMRLGFVATWGTHVYDSKVVHAGNAQGFGEFLGRRYGGKPHVFWILGGDERGQGRFAEVWAALAKGITVGTCGREDYSQTLMTFHPDAYFFSSRYYHDAPWLDFNMIQSAHFEDRESWEFVAADYAKRPVKPTIDAESIYEGHPLIGRAGEYSTAHDVRKANYRNLFAGAFGIAYGHHAIWQSSAAGREPIFGVRETWTDALDAPTAGQLAHAKNLMLSRPFFSRVPDQTLLDDERAGGRHLQATRDADGSYAFVYTPTAEPFRVRTGKLSGGRLKGWWFDPRTGANVPLGTFGTESVREFTPPAAGGPDWVLVLDDADRGFTEPGAAAKAAPASRSAAE